MNNTPLTFRSLFRVDSLLSRTMWIMVVLFALISSLVYWFWENRVEPSIGREEQVKADLLATTSAPPLALYLEHGDMTGLKTYVDNLLILEDPNTGRKLITGITVETVSGDMAVQVRPEEDGHFMTNTLLFSSGKDRHILGSLTLFFSPAFFQHVHEAGHTIMWGVLVFFGLILLASFLLFNYLLRPLWHLTRELQDFSVNRTEKIPPLDGPRSREIDRVAVAINELLVSQAQYQQHLEQMVEERTAELQRSNTALSESEEKYRSLVERSNDGIFIVHEGMIHYCNPKGAAITGYTTEELTWQPVEKVLLPGEQGKGAWEKHHRQGNGNKGQCLPAIYETAFRGKNGEPVFVELNEGPVPYRDGQANLIFIRDISERKRMEAELLKTRNLESLGVLAGGLAHDFNNLLTVIAGYVELSGKLVENDDRVSEMLTKAGDAAERARHLTSQLLTFSKGGEPVKSHVSLQQVVEDTCSLILSGSKVKYHTEIASDLLPVSVDKGQIGQVLQNLLFNANEAMEESGNIHITVENLPPDEMEIFPVPENDYVRVTVRDDGPGIDPAILPRVFDPYFSTKGKGAKRGNGLGLAICHSIVHRHNGVITVDSVVGQGTVFVILLPVTSFGNALGSVRSSEEPALLPEKGSGHVLLMDDEEAVRRVGGEVLTHLGYQCSFAANGEEAAQVFGKSHAAGQRFNAVILDLTVRGGMGGKEAIRELLKIDPQVRAIVASGYADDPIMAGYERFGFRGAVCKPFSIETLQKVLAGMERAG